MIKFISALVAAAAIATSLFGTALAADELVIYSARNEHLIKPLADAYTEKTGVPIVYHTGKAGALLERLRAEGENTPADLLITVDAGNLWHAARSGLLAPVDSPTLTANIPAELRDPESRWFGLSVRARTIVYNPERIDPALLGSYAALADPTLKGRLVLRTSKKVYNQSLVAALIEEHGAAEAERIVRGWVDNLAAAPFSNDTKTMEAIAAGIGDAGVVNTYYYGRLMQEQPDLPLRIHWPAAVHMNVSGGGVALHSDNKAEAQRFLEWLSTPEAQRIFADLNMEYPANPAVPPSETVAAWGEFTGSDLNVAVYGERQAEAVMLMDRAGYK